jgi:hypothetical protein
LRLNKVLHFVFFAFSISIIFCQTKQFRREMTLLYHVIDLFFVIELNHLQNVIEFAFIKLLCCRNATAPTWMDYLIGKINQMKNFV